MSQQEPASLVESQNEKQSADLEPASDPLAWLSEAERYAYRYFLQEKGKSGALTYPISADIASGMYFLYQNGKNLNEIRALNSQFTLGQIVYSAIAEDWYGKRMQYLAGLVSNVKSRAIQAAAEGVELTADMISAMKKLHSTSIAKYLQGGDPALIESAVSSTSIRQLRDLAELLSKLTGQENTKTIKGEVHHTGSIAMPGPPQQKDQPTMTLGEWAANERNRILKERG